MASVHALNPFVKKVREPEKKKKRKDQTNETSAIAALPYAINIKAVRSKFCAKSEGPRRNLPGPKHSIVPGVFKKRRGLELHQVTESKTVAMHSL